MIPCESTPTGTLTPRSSAAATEQPSAKPTATATTSTSTPSPPPTDSPENQTKDDGSPIATIALFTGVIGVVVGWALRELTAFLKGRAEAQRQKEGAEQNRVLEFIHTAEVLSASGNGIAVAYAGAASGKSTDPSQFLDLVNRYNEAQVQLDRLRLEIAILGPDWVGDSAMKVENAATALQGALRRAEQENDLPSFQALADEVTKFRDERTKLIQAATAKYQPGRAAPQAPQAAPPPAPPPNP